MGPRGRVKAYTYNSDVIQSVASVKVNFLGKYYYIDRLKSRSGSIYQCGLYRCTQTSEKLTEAPK